MIAETQKPQRAERVLNNSLGLAWKDILRHIHIIFFYSVSRRLFFFVLFCFFIRLCFTFRFERFEQRMQYTTILSEQMWGANDDVLTIILRFVVQQALYVINSGYQYTGPYLLRWNCIVFVFSSLSPSHFPSFFSSLSTRLPSPFLPLISHKLIKNFKGRDWF